MKIIFTILILCFYFNCLAAETNITCIYQSEDGDIETITGAVKNNEVVSVKYQTFQDHIGPFRMVKKNVFSYTKDDLIYELVISFNNQLKISVLDIYLKLTQSQLTTQTFNCR